MKSVPGFLLIAFAASAITFTSCSNTEPKAEEKTAATADTSTAMLAEGEKYIYQCPMDLEILSDKPAKCPKCGMDLERVVVKDSVKATMK